MEIFRILYIFPVKLIALGINWEKFLYARIFQDPTKRRDQVIVQWIHFDVFVY